MEQIVSIDEFATLLKVDRDAALRIVRANKAVKKKLPGIRAPHVDLAIWNKLVKRA